MHKYVPGKSAKKGGLAKPETTVSVVGARGYSGLELCRLLLNHPAVTLANAFATSDFNLQDELLLSKAVAVKCLPDSEILDNLTDVVFLATPAEVSLKLAPQILAAGKKVIDLSGAFRLKNHDYKKWYGFEHEQTDLLQKAHYGLLPFAKPISSSVNLIANPGCYATAISLALIPLLKAQLIEASTIVIDAKSGTTGAGKKAAENLIFSEVDGDCLPYKVGKHQHLPEIQESVQLFSSVSIDPMMTTHLLPVKRGITAAIYGRTKAKSKIEIEKAFQESFNDYPLVKFGTQISKLANLNRVVGTPMVHLSYELVDDKIFVFSCIDNLLKGAASQAIENLNAVLDLPLSFSLFSDSLNEEIL